MFLNFAPEGGILHFKIIASPTIKRYYLAGEAGIG